MQCARTRTRSLAQLKAKLPRQHRNLKTENNNGSRLEHHVQCRQLVEEAGCQLQPEWAHGAWFHALNDEIKERHVFRDQISFSSGLIEMLDLMLEHTLILSLLSYNHLLTQ